VATRLVEVMGIDRGLAEIDFSFRLKVGFSVNRRWPEGYGQGKLLKTPFCWSLILHWFTLC
jgi:hypothetical protein